MIVGVRFKQAIVLSYNALLLYEVPQHLDKTVRERVEIDMEFALCMAMLVT